MTTEPKASRRRMSPDQRRFQIVSAAMKLIAKEGYQGLTLRMVADACEMTTPGLMHYYPTRESLLRAVLDYYTLVLKRRAAMLVDDGAGARAALDEVVREIWQWPTYIKLYLQLSAEAIDEQHVAHNYLLSRHAHAVNDVSALIGTEHPDPTWAAEFFYFVLDGLRMRWVRDPEGFDPVAEWAKVADAVFAGTGLARSSASTL